jgi:N-acetylmuramoyl-L-alanine amidase
MQVLTDRRSPNYNSRQGRDVSMIVLHYTGMQSAGAAIERLCDEAAQVSAHYVIEESGTVHQLVDEAENAWHAGVSFWRGRQGVNPYSVGIEIVNPGHEWGYCPFPMPQMESVAELCTGILSRHAIKPWDVVGHSDVAPIRKEDPGEYFDWNRLSRHGIGLWPHAVPDLSGPLLHPGGSMRLPARLWWPSSAISGPRTWMVSGTGNVPACSRR